jgi:hypothetical protein
MKRQWPRLPNFVYPAHNQAFFAFILLKYTHRNKWNLPAHNGILMFRFIKIMEETQDFWKLRLINVEFVSGTYVGMYAWKWFDDVEKYIIQQGCRMVHFNTEKSLFG